MTPIDMFALLYGFSVLDMLGQSKIHPNQVILKPSLLKNLPR